MGEEKAAPAVAPSSCACSVGKDWGGGQAQLLSTHERIT